MDSEATSRRTPLEGLEGDSTLHMEERPPLGKIVFRGNPEEAVRRAFAQATGAQLPLKSNTTWQEGQRLVLWLGPNEWMLHLPIDDAGAVVQAIEMEADGLHAAAIDVSDYYTVIRIGGTHARDALAHGCPLDLHPSKFAKGSCAQSRFDCAAILLHHAEDDPVYDIQVRWSFAEHVWNILRTLGKELSEG